MMPEYSYICDTENEGCGHFFSVFQNLSQYKPLKKCPSCSKHRLIRAYEEDHVYSSTKSSTKGMTLGSLADKNTSRLSADEKESLRKKVLATYFGFDFKLLWDATLSVQPQ